MRYVVYVESRPAGYKAYVPDLPDCVAVAETREEAVSRIRDGIVAHHEGMKKAGKLARKSSPGELVTVNLA
jgi:predicted RNase H-like HicB family nuclease